MALRVLLADESTTIKKAIQMALSDLGVEVKSVPSGLDVLTVSRSYSPDIILADILLTKKNGYEVCAEIKSDPQLRTTPVVLMWSSFMQLDQSQYQKVKADAALEKPFDSESLRNVIERLVPKVSQFPLRGLLQHPQLPDFEESETFVKQKIEYYKANSQDDSQPTRVIDNSEKTQVIPASTFKNAPSNSEKTQVIPASKFNSPADSEKTQIINLKTFNTPEDEVDDFAEVPLKPKKPRPQSPEATDDWESQSADQFVVETESLNEDFEEVTVMTQAPTESGPDLQKRIQAELNSYIQDAPLAKSKATGSSSGTQSRPMSNLEEQILKEEIRMMAEKICWQILPDITEKIVREELGKLLHGLEKT